MKVGDLLCVTSMYQYDRFQRGDLILVLGFFSTVSGFTSSWHRCEMVRVLSKLGVVNITRSSLEKATLPAEES